MRRLIAAVSLVAVALLPACSRDALPSSLFNAGAYHVRGQKVYYLHSFPGDAFEIDGADDRRALPGADASTFELLDRPQADPSNFPPDRSVTRCDETSMSFAE